MAQALAPVTALLLAISFLILGHGLQSTLLPLAGSEAGFSELAIGLVSSSYFFGMVLGCLGAPYVIMRAGHIRAFAALVSLMSAAAILHPVLVEPVAWSLIRVVSGFCLAGFYMIVESWLNEQASNENRGTIMSIYIVIVNASMTVGQLSLTGMDVTTFVPFAVASVAVSLAVIPVSLTTANQPAPITVVSFRPVKLYRNSPTALVAALLIGVTQGALWMMAPLYAIQMGLSTNEAAYFTAAIIGAGALAQWPIGRISDRFDRRFVLLGLSGAAVVVGLVFIGAPITGLAVALVMALLAGVAIQPSYAIAVSHAFDHADRDDYVETSSGMILAFGIGSSIGPLSAAYLMQTVGPWGLFLQIAAVQALLGLYILSRLFQRAAPTLEEKTDFDYASTAQVGSVLTPDPLDIEDPQVISPEEFPAYETDPEADENLVQEETFATAEDEEETGDDEAAPLAESETGESRATGEPETQEPDTGSTDETSSRAAGTTSDKEGAGEDTKADGPDETPDKRGE
ncbi:MAG: MFS transporter [Stappia sp.]|uniref:MFS transporter n=1 Tax=Stappia sp. TaxID=1870903 RepID=UPI000C467FB2|nr:MFS transporter [Stappia sp.]MAA97936.1 MFS transporter [Stappia sp.]MBM19650.1 MFS transporter [Stappia sp.]